MQLLGTNPQVIRLTSMPSLEGEISWQSVIKTLERRAKASAQRETENHRAQRLSALEIN